MKLYGKAQQTGERLLAAFREPDKLPARIAPRFLTFKTPTPCRRWSPANQLLTAINGTQDARTFKQWDEAGRKVNKGEKAFYILAPCTRKITDKATSEDKMIVTGFRGMPVFALEQTTGDPVEVEHGELIDSLPLVEVARAWDINVQTYRADHGTAWGMFSRKRDGSDQSISVGVENPQVFLHELVHAADFRLGTLGGTPLKRETVAEFGAAILAECVGLPGGADLGFTFDYLRGYAAKENKDLLGTCVKFLKQTCAAVDLILETSAALQAVDAGELL